jgi:hypothetical protein
LRTYPAAQAQPLRGLDREAGSRELGGEVIVGGGVGLGARGARLLHERRGRRGGALGAEELGGRVGGQRSGGPAREESRDAREQQHEEQQRGGGALCDAAPVRAAAPVPAAAPVRAAARMPGAAAVRSGGALVVLGARHASCVPVGEAGR